MTAEGTRFRLGGANFNVAGANNHYLGWAARREVDDLLTTARNMGFNVVRSIMGCVIGSLDATSRRTVWDWKSRGDTASSVRGVYLLYWDGRRDTWAWNDSTVNGLSRWDYVLYQARQLGLNRHRGRREEEDAEEQGGPRVHGEASRWPSDRIASLRPQAPNGTQLVRLDRIKTVHPLIRNRAGGLVRTPIKAVTTKTRSLWV